MEGIVLFVSLSAMILVPLSQCITVQYCVHIGRDLNFAKLLLFSWSLALVFIPFSFFASMSILFNYLEESQTLSLSLLTVSFSYIIFGWLICSALYGKLILPKFSSGKIDLP